MNDALRTQIHDLRRSGLKPKQIADRLEISPSRVLYYLGSRRAGAVPSKAPVADLAPPADAVDAKARDPLPSGSSSAGGISPEILARESLSRLQHERDNATTAGERIRASEALLKHAAAAQKDEEWTPGPEALKSFIAELLERHPDLMPPTA